jgi:DNA (cytosine-5)-methyltransferase 1
VVENVKAYYEHFIPPTAEIGRHYLWANFTIPKIDLPKGEVGTMMKEYHGKKNYAASKKLEDRNAVNAELGLHILERALGIIKKQDINQTELF